MKIFLDTEFIDDGKTIELISIGLVREDGAEYYAEVVETMKLWGSADPWVKENVIAHLLSNTTSEFVPELKVKEKIKKEIVEFVGDNPQFWGYFADYDWVVLCQLYGRMIDLPEGWPMFCMDLKQLAVSKGIVDSSSLPEQNSTEHNALNDARWNLEVYQFLERIK